MKLNDFDKKSYAPRALEENYKMSFDVSNMSKIDTQKMLKKIRTLATEAKETSNFYEHQISPSYMKLVFMEQALVNHYNELMTRPKARIVFENEEVEKSQVVLAAQDMCDSIQKMLEDIGQMQVKELPALVDSIESEIGVNEAEGYNTQVSGQLDTLAGALKEAFAQLKAARDSITGQGGSFTDMGAEAGAETAVGMGDEAMGMGAEAGAEMAAPEPEMAEPEEVEPATGNVGREKR